MTNSCLTQETIGQTTTTISGTTIPGPVSLVIRRCKPFTANNIVKVTMIVRYDSPVKEAAHAVYVAPEVRIQPLIEVMVIIPFAILLVGGLIAAAIGAASASLRSSTARIACRVTFWRC